MSISSRSLAALLLIFLSYDKLVIAVGSTSSTFGVHGLEHCFQLKTIADARNIRQRILGACRVPRSSGLYLTCRAQTTLRRRHCQRRPRRNVSACSALSSAVAGRQAWRPRPRYMTCVRRT